MKATKHKDGTISIRMESMEAADLVYAILCEKSYNHGKLKTQIDNDSIREGVYGAYRDFIDAVQSTSTHDGEDK